MMTPQDIALRKLYAGMKALGEVEGRAPTWRELSDVLREHPIPPKHFLLRLIGARLHALVPGAKAEFRMIGKHIHVVAKTAAGEEIPIDPAEAAAREQAKGARSLFANAILWASEHGPYRAEHLNRRLDPILPGPLVMQDKAAAPYSSPMYAYRQACLPGFGPDLDGRVAVLPLRLYDMGVGRQGATTNRAAPLALRMFVEICLTVYGPEREMGDGRGAALPPIRMREFVQWLWGEEYRYARSRDWPRIAEALEILDSSAARVPIVIDPKKGTGVLRKVVTAVDIPATGHPDEWIWFRICLPAGSTRGPLVDRLQLRWTGRRSGLLYRLFLSLSFYWHRSRQPMRKRKGIWIQSTRPNDYAPLMTQDLVDMAYPGEMGVIPDRRRVARVRKALDTLESMGFIRRTQDGQILPGPNWIGWTDEQRKLLPPGRG